MQKLIPLYLQSTEFSETPSPDSDSINSIEGHSEPSWFKDIKFDDSDTEHLAEESDYTMPSMHPISNIIKNVVFTSVISTGILKLNFVFFRLC